MIKLDTHRHSTDELMIHIR